VSLARGSDERALASELVLPMKGRHMRTMATLILCVFGIWSGLAIAQGGTSSSPPLFAPYAPFFSEQELRESVVDIQRLSRHDVEALARVVSDCLFAFGGAESVRFVCIRAVRYFEVTTEDGSALRAIIGNLRSIATVLSAFPREASSLERLKYLERFAEIERAWAPAIRKRLAVLESRFR